MDNFFFGDAITTITNGVIEEITSENNTTFVIVSYSECSNCPGANQIIRLAVGNNTLILNENGVPMQSRGLEVGMTINAAYSAAMTRSIPPQAPAFVIRVVSRPMAENSQTSIGRILDIDRQNRSFTTIGDRNLSSVIRFNVPEDVRIFDRTGRSMDFSRLMPTMLVKVRHANFMTSSIPPQTTAFDIWVL